MRRDGHGGVDVGRLELREFDLEVSRRLLLSAMMSGTSLATVAADFLLDNVHLRRGLPQLVANLLELLTQGAPLPGANAKTSADLAEYTPESCFRGLGGDLRQAAERRSQVAVRLRPIASVYSGDEACDRRHDDIAVVARVVGEERRRVIQAEIEPSDAFGDRGHH